MKRVLNRWLAAGVTGWRSWVLFAVIYCIVVYQRTKWGLVASLPARLRVRCLHGK